MVRRAANGQFLGNNQREALEELGGLIWNLYRLLPLLIAVYLFWWMFDVKERISEALVGMACGGKNFTCCPRGKTAGGI
jgi:hypothetical protein